MENTQIQLIQKPEFKHELIALGADIRQRYEAMRLDELAATPESIEFIKKTRTDLNKEEDQLDSNFKSQIEPAVKIIDELKAIKKEHATNIYAYWRKVLTDKINPFETEVKEGIKKEIEVYFSDLCAANQIDFVKFDQVGLKINLSTSKKQHKEQCQKFISRISDEIKAINSMQYAAEMLAEYKGNGFNASAAISKVNQRKESEKLETDRLKIKETERREAMLRGLTMVWHDLTKTYNFVRDENIFVTYQEINGLSKEDFQILYLQIEARINATKQVVVTPPKIIEAVNSPSIVEPKTEEKTQTARFEVTGSMQQLLKLKDFLIQNNFNYKNLVQ